MDDDDRIKQKTPEKILDSTDQLIVETDKDVPDASLPSSTVASEPDKEIDEKLVESEETEVEDGNSQGNAENENIGDETEVPQTIKESINQAATEQEVKTEDKDKSPKKRKISDILQDDDALADQEFSWDEYLEDTGSSSVPPTAFLHVEESLDSGLKFKMALEVPNREDEECFWLATIVMTCGPLLSLRYVGYGEDRANDFWWNISTSEVHPLGWCLKNNKRMFPPEGVRKLCLNWEFLLTQKYEPVPSFLLECQGSIPIDQIKPGMKLEVQDGTYPIHVWVATVIENVGGRLLLRYYGVESGSQDFWLFYLSHLVHPIGWAKEHNYLLSPPPAVKSEKSEEEWEPLIISSQDINENAKSISQDVLLCQQTVAKHSFEENMKLEALNPNSKLSIYPATVKIVLNEYYFIVEIDDYRKEESVTMCCHSLSQDIFPIDWARDNNLKLKFPKGYLDSPGNKEFDWEEYLSFCNAKSSPISCFPETYNNPGFEVNAKLEVVNPFQPNQICAGTILNVAEPLLFIQVDNIDTNSCHHIVPFNTMDIFPVGWCESNNFPLKPPRTSFSKRQKALLRRPSSSSQDTNFKMNTNGTTKEGSKSWCSKIYFNHRCFSGPFLSKGRLAQLPQHIGPGPVTLVMREVVSSLINVAYISSRVLRELQLRGKPTPNMNQEVLKAKWKNKSYRAVVEVVTKSENVDEFCKQVCKKLQCCPYLFGLQHFEGDCPDKCFQLTKTNYAQNAAVLKKRKITGPNLCVGNIPNRPGGRKRRRSKWRIAIKARQQRLAKMKKKECEAEKIKENPDDDQNDCKQQKEKEKSEKDSYQDSSDANKQPAKKNYKHCSLPKSSMVTRGAKIPNFSLEMKWRRQRVNKIITPTKINNLSDNKCKISHPARVYKHFVTTKGIQMQGLGNSGLPRRKLTVEELLTVPEPIVRPIPLLQFDKNPVKWTVQEVFNFINQTECAPIAKALEKEEVDGQSLLLMTLPVAQEFLQLKFGPAVRLCHLVEGIKLAFYMQYNNTNLN